MSSIKKFLWASLISVLLVVSCRSLTVPPSEPASSPVPAAQVVLPTLPPATPTPTEMAPLPALLLSSTQDANEPTFISGDIPFTSPFFLETVSESFVMLEDQAGFARRDQEFEFPVEEQVIGPVIQDSASKLHYDLALPLAPRGTLIDVDNNKDQDKGVQVFAIAYWSNTWGGPFLEKRDGTGWSNSYASTRTDKNNNYEITGGKLIAWAPDSEQKFPTDFGPDGLLFTSDDPVAPIPPGYNIVDLDQRPFKIRKERQPDIPLIEGPSEVKDFSSQSYSQAFKSMFDRVSKEYPFTEAKHINWASLYDQFAPRMEAVKDERQYYLALRDFANSIPDGHVNLSPDRQVLSEVFYEEHGGGFGLVLQELSDGTIIVTQVISDTPGDQAGIQRGAQILIWNGLPIAEAVSKIVPPTGPFSTDHTRRRDQVLFLTRVPPETWLEVSFINPGQSEQKTRLKAQVEYDSFFNALYQEDELVLPIQGEILDKPGLAYIQIPSFMGDTSLMSRLWSHYIHGLIDNHVPGLIIDIRHNGGGFSKLARDFAGYFFDQELVLYRNAVYSTRTGKFEYAPLPSKVEPGPVLYDGPIAVLIGPDCVSACESFAYALQQQGRATLIGNYPTAGAYGEVGQGQYKLPGSISGQFPTGRSETLDGQVLIEGQGVLPDITVPITAESVLQGQDTVLETAILELLKKINNN